MFRNFLQCYDQFRISSVGVKITPQYLVDAAQMANYYYRWNRDGDHNIGFYNVAGENGEANATTAKMVKGYSTVYPMYSTNAAGQMQMDYFASSVKNSQSTKQKFINVGATGSSTYMSIRASTATEKSRYANSYDVLNRLRNTLDGTLASAKAFAEIHQYLDEELDFYPTLSIVSDAENINMNFVFQITACVTFRGPGETRVVPAFTTQPVNPDPGDDPGDDRDPEDYVGDFY